MKTFFGALHHYMANGGPNPFAWILFVMFMVVVAVAIF